MKILYDHQAFVLQKRGGVSRYFFALIHNFKKSKEVEIKLALRYSDNQYLNETKSSSGNNRERSGSHSGWFTYARNKLKKNRFILNSYIYIKDEVNKKNSLKEIIKGDYDVFHPTYYDPYFLNDLPHKPFVLTVHDMIHEIFPEYFSKNDLTSSRKKILIKKATKVIAVSENTKKDILKYIEVPEEKIHVIHHANYLESKEGEMPIKLPERYILFVGGRRRYKNFSYFIESISEILKKDKDLYVICFGGGNFSKEELEHFDSLKISKNVIQLEGNDRSLVYAYKNAICLTLPSLYEGFGIPILEAFSCGCPVALSDASCFPEIAQDGGAYFNPRDKTSIADTIDRFLTDEEFKDELVRKGYERLKDFSEEKMLSETQKIYQECLK